MLQQILDLAVKHTLLDAVQCLLAHGVLPDAASLRRATKTGKEAIFMALMRHVRARDTGEPHTIVSRDLNDLFLRSTVNNNVFAVQMLLDMGADVSLLYSDALLHACFLGHVAMVRYFLEHLSNGHEDALQEVAVIGERALYLAVRARHYQVADLLKPQKWMNLHAAARRCAIESSWSNDVRTIKYLLDSGLDIPSDAVAVACGRGSLAVVKLLAIAFDDVDMLSGRSLRAAVECCQLDVLDYLVRRGVDVDYDGGFALKIAVAKGDMTLIELFKEYGANVRINDDEILGMACGRGEDTAASFVVRWANETPATGAFSINAMINVRHGATFYAVVYDMTHTLSALLDGYFDEPKLGLEGVGELVSERYDLFRLGANLRNAFLAAVYLGRVDCIRVMLTHESFVQYCLNTKYPDDHVNSMCATLCVLNGEYHVLDMLLYYGLDCTMALKHAIRLDDALAVECMLKQGIHLDWSTRALAQRSKNRVLHVMQQWNYHLLDADVVHSSVVDELEMLLVQDEVRVKSVMDDLSRLIKAANKTNTHFGPSVLLTEGPLSIDSLE